MANSNRIEATEVLQPYRHLVSNDKVWTKFCADAQAFIGRCMKESLATKQGELRSAKVGLKWKDDNTLTLPLNNYLTPMLRASAELTAVCRKFAVGSERTKDGKETPFVVPDIQVPLEAKAAFETYLANNASALAPELAAKE